MAEATDAARVPPDLYTNDDPDYAKQWIKSPFKAPVIPELAHGRRYENAPHKIGGGTRHGHGRGGRRGGFSDKKRTI